LYSIPEPDIYASLLLHQWTHRQDSTKIQSDISIRNTRIVTSNSDNERFLFKRLPTESSGDSDEVEVIVTNIPERMDFLHPAPAGQASGESVRAISLPLNECTFGDVPLKYCMFSLFVPSILRRIELALVAEELPLTIRKPVDIENVFLIQTVITHGSTRSREL
jgi:hypothetical protein